MFWVVVIFLFLPFIFLSINKDIKQSNFIGLLLLILLLLIFSFNNGNQDYKPYLDIFYNPETYSELGYLLLVNFVKFMGGSHSTIVFLTGVFLTITLFRVFKVFKVNFSIICILYFIYPFIFDITQIRNTIMLFFVLNGLIEVYNNKMGRALVLILIGSFFHNFVIVYFLIISIYRFYKNSISKIFFVGLVLMLFLPFFFTFILPAVPIARVQSLVSNYLSNSVKIHSLIIWGVDYFIFITIAFYLCRYISSQYYCYNKSYDYIEFLFKILLIHIVFLGFLMYFFEFNRVYRNAFILRYLFIGACLPILPFRIQIKLAVYIFVNALVFSYLSTINLDESYSYEKILTSNKLLDFFN
jgi:hypothetical protein